MADLLLLLSLHLRMSVSISSSAEGYFDLHAVKSPMNFNDSFPCVVVPNYVREELIATLKGEW